MHGCSDFPSPLKVFVQDKRVNNGNGGSCRQNCNDQPKRCTEKRKDKPYEAADKK